MKKENMLPFPNRNRSSNNSNRSNLEISHNLCRHSNSLNNILIIITSNNQHSIKIRKW